MNLRNFENYQPADFLYLEADVNYTIFHLTNGKKVISSFTLKRFEQIPELKHFLRISRGTLVNPLSILCVEKQGNVSIVRLRNGSEVKVSRRRKNALSFVV